MSETFSFSPFNSITEITDQFRLGNFSPVEAVQVLSDRIEKFDSSLNSFAAIDIERALEKARTAEKLYRAGGETSPLLGVPIAVKDLCWTTDFDTAAGMKVLKGWRPDKNATVVDRLEAAGAIMLGKLNTTEGAFVGYHPDFTAPKNPWNRARWAGVSSSGPAVSVAAGFCFGALGSDTGGSIRTPSASCGIVGLKPTYGRVSRYGVVPLSDSLDHIGPMTRRVEDCAIMLAAIAGYDAADPTTSDVPLDNYSDWGPADLNGLRIGYDETYDGEEVDSEVLEAIQAARKVFEKRGAELRPVTMTPIKPLLDEFMNIVGVDALNSHREWFPTRAAEYGEGLRSFLEASMVISATDYAGAQMLARKFQGGFAHLLLEIDLLLCPSWATPAQPVGPDGNLSLEVDSGLLLKFTAPFNASGNPTLSVPCGFTKDGLPLSLQLVGRHFEEALLLRAGHVYEQSCDWISHVPNLEEA